MTYSVEIRDTIATPFDELERVQLGWRPGFGLYSTYAMVFEDGKPLLSMICCTESNEYHFHTSANIWHQRVIVGAGHKLFMFGLEDRSAEAFNLESYYGYTYTTEHILLAASGRHIHAFAPTGESIWVARNLGIDGVVIDRIDDVAAHGSGQIDPPDGWKRFQVDLNTGQVTVK